MPNYVPWYDRANISFIMHKFGFCRDDAIDYIYYSFSPIERLKYGRTG